MSKETLSEFMNEITEDICDNYCKYPDQYGPGDEEAMRLYEEHCDDCPLNRLEVCE